MLNAVRHKIDNGLRRIDNAVRIGGLHRKALKELLIDRVEEVLFLGEVIDCFRGLLNRFVEVVKTFEKLGAAERLRRESVDDLLDLVSDSVAPCEVGVSEDFSENPLGQEVLNEHLLDSGFGEIGVDGLTAFLVEIRKGHREPAVGLSLPLDQRRQPAHDVGHFVLELRDGLFPFGDLCRTIKKEGLERLDKAPLIGQIRVENGRVILPQDRPLGAFGTGCCLADSPPQTCVALRRRGRREYPLLPNSRAAG